jgi:hypothetical protein
MFFIKIVNENIPISDSTINVHGGKIGNCNYHTCGIIC